LDGRYAQFDPAPAKGNLPSGDYGRLADSRTIIARQFRGISRYSLKCLYGLFQIRDPAILLIDATLQPPYLFALLVCFRT
jgi:hypothetical protein